MDFIKPGFYDPPKSKIETSSDHHPQRNPPVPIPQQEGRVSSSTGDPAPLTDVNRERVESHWENMKALKKRVTVHLSRSLDHYCHKQVSSAELEKRVKDQVLTRFMNRQILNTTGGKTLATEEEEAGHPKTFRSLLSGVASRLRPYSSRNGGSNQLASSMEKGLEEAKDAEEAAGNTAKGGNAATVTDDAKSPLQILVTPQLWLWKFDSECKFPKRR